MSFIAFWSFIVVGHFILVGHFLIAFWSFIGVVHCVKLQLQWPTMVIAHCATWPLMVCNGHCANAAAIQNKNAAKCNCTNRGYLFKFGLSGITVNWFYAFDEDFWFLNYFTIDQMWKILDFWNRDTFHESMNNYFGHDRQSKLLMHPWPWTILKKQIAFPYFSGLNGSVATKQLSAILLFGSNWVAVRIGVSVKKMKFELTSWQFYLVYTIAYCI